MVNEWLDTTGARVTDLGAGGDFYLQTQFLDKSRPFILGAVATDSGEFSVQLWGEVLGARTNIGGAVAVVAGTPASWPDEYTCTGMRGITVSVTTPGSLEVGADQ